MADNTDMEVMTVLPKELRLGAPPTMPQARSYLFRQQSTLSAYNPDEQIQINIPRLQRSYLSKDSYLQFRLNGEFEPATPVDVGTYEQFVPDLFLDDAGAWGLFERLEVFDYLGSTVLESTDSVPQLISLLIDMGASFTDPDHKGPVAHGLSGSYVATTSNNNSIAYTVVANNRPTQRVSAGSSTVYPFTLANPQIQFNGTTYTWTSTATFSTFSDFLEALNTWLATLTDPTTGQDLEIEARASTKWRDSIDFFKDGQSFTVGLIGATTQGPGSLMSYTGHNFSSTTTDNDPPTYVSPISSTNAGVNIASSTGIGKSFYVGGTPLVTYGTTRNTTNAKQSFSVQYSIPLPSFLGFLSKKMVPLHNGFTIVLTLASQYKPMFMASKQVPTIIYVVGSAGDTTNVQTDVVVQATNTQEPRANVSTATNPNAPANIPNPTTFWWNITDVAMVCQILELGPVAESMILSSSQGQPLIVHSKQLRNYRGVVGSSAADFSLPLNLNVSSLTNILWFMRPDNIENDLRYASVATRIRNWLWRWEFQYGSTVLPQSQGIQCMYTAAPIVPSGKTAFTGNFLRNSQLTGLTECFSELMKSRPTTARNGRFSASNYFGWWNLGGGQFTNFGTTPWRCWEGSGNYQGDYVTPKFACGLNTELVTGKSGELICGLNTNGMNTTIRGYIHPSYITDANRTSTTIDAYAEYDAFINISPGIATTVSY